MTLNPYQPPTSSVEKPRVKRELGAIGVVVVVLAALQGIWSVIYVSSDFEMVRVGEMAPISFLLISISVVALVAGGVLLILNQRSARYAAVLSLILSLLLVLGSRSILYEAQAIVAASMLVFSVTYYRAKDA
jgi:hypothetical protein